MYNLGQRIREVPWNIRNANSRIDGNIFWASQIDLHQIWQKQPKPKSRNQLSPRAGSISALEIFPFAKLKICETPSFASRLYFVGNYSLGIIKLKLFTNITKLWLGAATFRFIGRRPIIISQFCETITIRVHTVYWQPLVRFIMQGFL